MSDIINGELISPLLGVIQIGIIFRVAIKLIEAHGDERGLSVAINQCKHLILIGGIAICMTDILSRIKGCFSSNNLFDGIQKLLSETTASLTLIEVMYTAFLTITIGIAWQQSSENEQGSYRKRLLHTIFIGILVVSTTNMLPVIFGYFK